MNQYQLSRHFWDYSFEHTGKLKPNHIALYFFAVEHCNRLGWKKRFGLPTSMVLDAINIKSYSVYKKTFDDLVEMGFFEVVEYSKNQYSSNIIALKEYSKAHDKALDKAITKHASKQVQSTHQSNDSIDKQIQTNTEPVNRDYLNIEDFEGMGYEFGLDEETKISFNEFLEYRSKRNEKINDPKVIEKLIKEMMLKSPNQKHWVRMIDFTISKTAKNIITDIDLKDIPIRTEKTQAWFNYYHEYVAYCEREGITPEPQIAA